MVIKHSHQTGKLSHLECVILITEASQELGLEGNIRFSGDHNNVLKLALQKAYELGKEEQ